MKTIKIGKENMSLQKISKTKNSTLLLWSLIIACPLALYENFSEENFSESTNKEVVTESNNSTFTDDYDYIDLTAYEASETLMVEYEIKTKIVNGNYVFYGKTNFPEGMKLHFSILNKGEYYNEDSPLVIKKDGYYETKEFGPISKSKGGKHEINNKDTYKVKITAYFTWYTGSEKMMAFLRKFKSNIVQDKELKGEIYQSVSLEQNLTIGTGN